MFCTRYSSWRFLKIVAVSLAKTLVGGISINQPTIVESMDAVRHIGLKRSLARG
jgi:hypothetical protein